MIRHYEFSLYYISIHKLVKKAKSDGEIVGTRGSVGASFVAYLLGITGFNPLDYNLQYEMFAGIDGDIIPDIDLNFNGEYVKKAQNYFIGLIGKDCVFRAGTIATIQNKTALEFIRRCKKNCHLTHCDVEEQIKGIVGVKRCDSQHPGGLVVVPGGYDVYDFTPIQHSNYWREDIITTHFNFRDLPLWKMDILGHDTMRVLKELQDSTGVEIESIPLDDEKTLHLLKSADTCCIPEFGEKFAQEIIKTAKPQNFDDMVKISGLLHGGDVWNNNAEDLTKSGTATISEVIADRDDIMIYLMSKGIERSVAYQIMESVRTGRGLSELWVDIMNNAGVPDWYIKSCKKIKYLFPKAHAVAYTIMAFRMAWFKAHYLQKFNFLMLTNAKE
jgi:DNA polymerase-3 subunit alpha (Gram-positive type)